MNLFLYFLGLCAVAATLFGYMTFFHQKFNIHPSVTPIMTISTVTVFIYLVGFTGLLSLASIAVYVIGAVLLIRTVILCFKKRYDLKVFIFSPGIIAFALFSVFFIIITRGITLLHVDNFSHWATAVKDMYLTDAYPKLSGAVTFRNYTPGAAVFIYHVCKAVIFTESHALMAQGIIIAACAAPLFCKVKLREPLAFAAICFIFVGVISILTLEGASLAVYNLIVDSLIAHFAAAAVVIAFLYRRDIFRTVITLTPITLMLSLIKNNGKVLAVIIIVFILILFLKEYFHKTSYKKKLTLLSVFCGIFVLNLALPWFWDTYADIVFEGYKNKFPSGLGVFSAITSKDPSFLKDVFRDMLAEITDFTSTSVIILVTSFAVACIITVICAFFKGKVKFMLKVVAASLCVFVFYFGELFILYGFIFPEAEAVILASFYRYFSTVVILLSTVLLTASVYAVQSLDVLNSHRLSRTVSSVLILAIAFTSLFTVKDNLKLLKDPYSEELTAVALEKRDYFISFYNGVSETVPPNSYIIVFTEKTDFFTTTLPQYELRTSHCLFIYPYMAGMEELITSRLEYPEYFVVESGDDTFKAILQAHGYTVTGNSTVYRVDQSAKILTPQ